MNCNVTISEDKSLLGVLTGRLRTAGLKLFRESSACRYLSGIVYGARILGQQGRILGIQSGGPGLGKTLLSR